MNKINIFITATNTEIGKTYTTIKLLEQYSKMGFKVGVFKPIETGVLDIAQDASVLLKRCKQLNPDFLKMNIYDITPYQYRLPAAPYVAKDSQKIDFNTILSNYENIARVSDIILIEGAGGLMVPVQDDFYMIDFIDFFNASALLVTHNKLGCINDTLLSIEALRNRKAFFEWCINLKHDQESFEKTTLPFYKNKFGKILTVQNDLDKIAKKLIINSNCNRNFS